MSGDVTGSADLRLVARVRKLMAKAEASAHPHEADAFARKAADLVARHRIDPEQLAAAAAGRSEELAIREILLGRGAYVRGRLALLMAIADAHDAKVVFGSRPEGTTAYVAGYAVDLDVVEVMYQSLHAQMAAQMANERRSTAAATQRFRRSFMFGFADRIGRLLSETRRVVEQDAPTTPSGTTAPALPDRTRRVEEFLEESFGRVRTARTSAGAELRGWSAGAAAAEGVDVGRRRFSGRRAIGPA
jgi:hypothetical protein